MLLEDNSQLPEKDRLDRREFELDVDEQTRRLAQGEDKVADLKTDLKAWNIARREVAMSVKGDVWDKMEVQGRNIVERSTIYTKLETVRKGSFKSYKFKPQTDSSFRI